MQILRETDGTQIIYRLKASRVEETLGEAVVSEVENEVRLHGIFVKPRFRGRGYGRSIMNAILQEARTKRVTLCTGLGNVAFFRQFGFEVADTGESLVSMERKPSINP